MSETGVVADSPHARSRAAFLALKREIASQGWDRERAAPVVLELVAHLTLSLVGIACLVAADSLLVRALGLLASTAGSLGVATNTHTSSHYATSRLRRVNEALTYFGYPFFVGMSATYWWHKHLVVHHPSPNVIGVDDDIDLSPWFAMTEPELSQSRGARRFYYRHLQWLVFPPTVALNGFNMQASGLRYLARLIQDPRRRRTAHWLDLAMLAAHVVVFFVVPLLWFPVWRVLAFNCVRIALLGYAMFAVFAPGHFPAEAVRLDKQGQPCPPWLLQTGATLNFRPGVLSAFCSGLQYQIEHHLFPKVSHVHHPAMSSHVRRFCQEAGLPYRENGWGRALLRSWMTLRHPQRVRSYERDRIPREPQKVTQA
jgi:fatty acid desaturase